MSPTLRLLLPALCTAAIVGGGCGDDEDGGGSGSVVAGGSATTTTAPAGDPHGQQETTGTHPGNGARPQSGAGRTEGATVKGGLLVGIGEHGTAMFDDARFRSLGVKHARLVVAYDATKVKFEREIVDAWLAGAKRAGVEPFITFGHSRVSPKKLPSVAEFRTRFAEFRERWPQVTVIAPWNEANHASQPTAGDPARAADFYDAAREVCADCTLVAGDLLDEPDLPSYLRRYRAALDSEPAVWGLHNYSDTNRFRTTGIRRMLGGMGGGELWLTETGGVYSFGRGFPPDARRQARAVRYTLRLARKHPEVRRVYLYNWTGAQEGARFDAGLTDADGSLRPAYGELQRALAAG